MNSEDGACKQECVRMQAKPRTWQKLALQIILSGTQVVQGTHLKEFTGASFTERYRVYIWLCPPRSTPTNWSKLMISLDNESFKAGTPYHYSQFRT